MTIEGVPLQAWPTDIRGVWVPELGQALVGADFSAVELIIAAALTQSADFIARVQKSDIYVEFSTALGVSRTVAKSALISYLYGETRVGRVERFGSVKSAIEAEETLNRLFPELVTMAARFEKLSESGQPLATMFGRPLPKPIDKRGNLRHSLACNLVVQGTGRDVLGMAVRKAHDAGVNLWAPMHDELLASCSIGSEEATLRLLIDAMTVELAGTSVSLTAVGTIFGARWGAK